MANAQDARPRRMSAYPRSSSAAVTIHPQPAPPLGGPIAETTFARAGVAPRMTIGNAVPAMAATLAPLFQPPSGGGRQQDAGICKEDHRGDTC
jgi:hypothetical protein